MATNKKNTSIQIDELKKKRTVLKSSITKSKNKIVAIDEQSEKEKNLRTDYNSSKKENDDVKREQALAKNLVDDKIHELEKVISECKAIQEENEKRINTELKECYNMLKYVSAEMIVKQELQEYLKEKGKKKRLELTIDETNELIKELGELQSIIDQKQQIIVEDKEKCKKVCADNKAEIAALKKSMSGKEGKNNDSIITRKKETLDKQKEKIVELKTSIESLEEEKKILNKKLLDSGKELSDIEKILEG